MAAEDSSRVSVFTPEVDDVNNPYSNSTDVNGPASKSKFREFFRSFHLNGIYLYRESIIRQWNRREYFIEVDIGHLNQYDKSLYDSLQVEFSNWVMPISNDYAAYSRAIPPYV